jgi:TRAP-type C4-dicarboxylate transport system substrate-binding protein
MIMKKVVLSLSLVLVLSILLTGPSASARDSKPIKLKAIISAPYRPGGPGQEYVDFCKRVTERSKGELIIDFKGGAEIMPVPTQFEAIRKGVVDMGWLFTGIYRKLVPEVKSFAVSDLSPDEERKVGYHDFLIEVHKKAGMYYVGRLPGEGFVITTVKKRIKNPSSGFKGLKFAVIGTMFNQFLENLGAVPVMIAPHERYTAFDRGIVDGDAGGSTSHYFMGYADVLKYSIDHRFWIPGGSSSLMRLESWNKLPKHLQDLIKDEQIKSEKLMPGYWGKVVAKAKEKNIEKGMVYTKFSPANAKWFLDKAEETKWEELKEEASPASYSLLRDLLKK